MAAQHRPRAEAGGVRPLRVLTRLAAFLHARGIAGADGISRAVLEDYLAGLHAAMAGRPEHGTHVSMTGLFLTAVRQHGWAPDLPPDAMIFPGDQPPRTELLPRALAGHVMAQVEQPGNLAREENPAYRLVTLILIRCGLRVSDALRLPFDCVTADDAGAPYLRYYNHKMKREALVPIDEEVRALISEQQNRVLGRYPLRDRAVPPDIQEPRRPDAGQQPHLPAGPLPLAGTLRHPRRARRTGASHAPSVEAHAGHPPHQPRRPPARRAENTLRPSISPSQPSRWASAMRAWRLSRISSSRFRWAGSGLRSEHLTPR